ncbi:MAG: hypothetical protein TREMPRED_004349 [Tremellales sp. Tagirdzhanova-0007]|nr:MAG: hypothetical protein TREMPRED_004349 [Tremellales sp. Tagirdzhanova-0007]
MARPRISSPLSPLHPLHFQRTIYSTRLNFASDPELPPSPKTAAELGFTRNAGRVRDISKLDISLSSRSHVKPATTRKKEKPDTPIGQLLGQTKEQVVQEKHAPEAGITSTTERENVQEVTLNEPSQDFYSSEVANISPARPRKNRLERVSFDPDGVLPALPPGEPVNKARGNGVRSMRSPSRPSRPDSQSPAERSSRREFTPRTASGSSGPRRDSPPRRDNGPTGSRGPRSPMAPRARSARSPRLDSPRAERPIIRREPRPPPPAAKIDQSWDTLFGPDSMITPVPRIREDSHRGVWAKGLDPGEARRHATLAVAGAYAHVLPKLPLPSDPSVASKPVARAKSTIAWSLAMNRSCTLGAAKSGEEVVARFVGR